MVSRLEQRLKLYLFHANKAPALALSAQAHATPTDWVHLQIGRRRRMPSFNPHRAQRQTAIHDGDTAVEKYDGVARPVHTVRVVLMQLPALAATSRRLLECAALPLCFATCAAT
jgi:hypothetical protein